MEAEKSAHSIALRYAIITSLILLILSVIFYVTNLYMNQKIALITYAVFIAGIVITILQRKNKELNGFISFGEGFKTGFFFSLYTSLISSVISYIMLKFIIHDMIDNIRKETERKMIEQGMPEEQMEMAMSWMNKIMTPGGFTAIGFVYLIVIGVVVSLIVAAIVRKDPQQLQQPQ